MPRKLVPWGSFSGAQLSRYPETSTVMTQGVLRLLLEVALTLTSLYGAGFIGMQNVNVIGSWRLLPRFHKETWEARQHTLRVQCGKWEWRWKCRKDHRKLEIPRTWKDWWRQSHTVSGATSGKRPWGLQLAMHRDWNIQTLKARISSQFALWAFWSYRI